MKTTVYYFSGTGNSLYIAKILAGSLNAELLPMTGAAGLTEIRPGADAVGLVYPVYYNDLPMIVREFAGRLRGIEKAYVFAVCTYGGCGSRSIKSLEEIITASGGALTASYGLHMPQNAFSKPWESNIRLVESAGRKAEKIARAVKARKTGNNLKGFLNFVFLRLHPKLLPGISANLSKRAGLSPEDGLDRLIRASDRLYEAGNGCMGCGLCEKVCPVGNIALENGRPKWLGHCENCLACYDWCPARAISGGVAHSGYFYTNPKIKAAEIMAQSNRRVSPLS